MIAVERDAFKSRIVPSALIVSVTAVSDCHRVDRSQAAPLGTTSI